MNQIINMIIRQVMNQLINRGVRAGFDKAGQVGQRRKQAQLDDAPQPQMTKEERQANRQARQQAKRMRQSATTASRIPKL